MKLLKCNEDLTMSVPILLMNNLDASLRVSASFSSGSQSMMLNNSFSVPSGAVFGGK